MMSEPNYVRWFNGIRLEDGPIVGARNAWLGELYSVLSSKACACQRLCAHGSVLSGSADGGRCLGQAHTLLDGLAKGVGGLPGRAAAARQLVFDATSGEDLRRQVALAYRRLEADYGRGRLAVRSSAITEDVLTASFDGLHDSFINVRGESDVFDACRRLLLLSSLDRGIVYRLENGLAPPEGRTFGRRHENGAVRHRVERGDRHARHRVRIPGCCFRYRPPWPRHQQDHAGSSMPRTGPS